MSDRFNTHSLAKSLCIAAWKGNLQEVRQIVEEEGVDPKHCLGASEWTPVHYSADGGNLQVVKYLIEEQHCGPERMSIYGRTPLHHSSYRGYLHVLKYLVEEQHCDPKCVDSNGYTPLHHASEWGHVDVVKYLLVVHHCDPNCKIKDGRTPLDLAVGHYPAVARELINAGAKSTTKPPQPRVKIFIVGNPSAGKSSLTKALQTETSALGATLASITGPRLVSDVEQKTAGIVPCQFTSRKYGHVTFYDFAGQQEYYASHAALLQNSISSSAPLFIIVVNLCDSEEDIKQKLVYWISFLANQCTSVTTKPHVIIVGSHSDVVRSRGEDPRAKVNMEFLQATHGFHISKFIPMDCRQSNSRDISKLADTMKDSCVELRKQLHKAHHLHHLFTFLLDRFKGVPAVSFKDVLNISSTSLEEVPASTENPEYLNIGCSKLQEAGRIMYIMNPKDIAKSWIILDQASLLSEVNGVLFAPEDFQQHCNLSNATGVVPVSRLAQTFPQHNLGMLVQFLSLLEFCCEIHNREVLQLLCPEEHLPPTENTTERFLFFSGLVSLKAPSGMWETNPQFPQLCGWMLQCHEAGQFLTSQFIQVLLLRISFSCALAPDTPGSSDLPVLQRKCSIWKNGIYWGSRKGVEALVEIKDPPQNKEVVVMLRCGSGQEVECARLRSTIIEMVLEAKEKLCSKVPTKGRRCWRGDSGTYESLRETLDQFSVFAGRNPLVSFMSYY